MLKKGPVVVTFYRGGWCPYCNLELRAFQRVLPDIEAAGASLVAISPEKPDDTLSTAEKNALIFEVLSDVGRKVGRAFPLVYDFSDELKSAYDGFGLDIPAKRRSRRMGAADFGDLCHRSRRHDHLRLHGRGLPRSCRPEPHPGASETNGERRMISRPPSPGVRPDRAMRRRLATRILRRQRRSTVSPQ
jgi:hypothetical protein